MKKTILITGATGFLGRELVKFYIEKGCSVIAIGRTEKKVADLKNEYKNKPLSVYCGDVTNSVFMDIVFFETKPTHAIHTAALKRIDVCQDNPIEACRVNVDGTKIIIDQCKKYGSKLVFISTDKACKPCTTYGATKYLAEQLVRKESNRSKNFYGCALRYGNVLDSTGSVFSVWKDQYSKTGKVMVRDKHMTRFFWLVYEAVEFIDQAIDSFERGEIRIPDINAINIYDAACYLYGKDNVYIGECEHNEKIHEEMAEGICSKDFVIDARVMLEDLNLK